MKQQILIPHTIEQEHERDWWALRALLLAMDCYSFAPFPESLEERLYLARN